MRERILSIVNDKGSYAVEKAFENMCENERYSISEYGYEEDFNEDEVVDIISENFVFKR